jgi:hypothetical protein
LGGVRSALVGSAGEARQAHTEPRVSVLGALQKPLFDFETGRRSEINPRLGERLVLFEPLRWCTNGVQVG